MGLTKKRLVIIGGGYAGVRVARDVARVLGDQIEIVLVSESDEHVDAPLLYEIATVFLPKENRPPLAAIKRGVSVPTSELFYKLPVKVRKARVVDIKTRERMVVLEAGETMSFDWLVVSVGTKLNTFGVAGVKEHGFSLESLQQATRLRQHITRQMMESERLTGERQAAARTFVVVGAGATGVETAAELVGLLKKVCWARGYDLKSSRVILLEAGQHVLREMPEYWQNRVRKRLESLGIEIWLEAKVAQVNERSVALVDEREIETNTVIWSGGLCVHPLFTQTGWPLAEWGVKVNDKLQVVGQPLVFAAGDCARVDGQSVPANVPVAYGEGSVVARNIGHAFRGEDLEKYVFKEEGMLVALGSKRALLIFPSGWGMMGWLPWLVKKLVSLRYWMWYLPVSKAFSYWWQGLKMHSQND